MSGRTSEKALSLFDDSYRRQGYRLIAGVDEAGRGPLAGPVVAAAVILKQEASLPGIDDSKKLTAKQRDRALYLVMENSLAVGIGIIEAPEIDRMNILQASLIAMYYAVCSLNQTPDLVLVDGNRTPGKIPKGLTPGSIKAVVSGDSKSLSIASASIIAKCLRDSLMRGHHKDFPCYGFDKHKGYGTRAHLAALNEFGPCPIHRKSFEPVKSLMGA